MTDQAQSADMAKLATRLTALEERGGRSRSGSRPRGYIHVGVREQVPPAWDGEHRDQLFTLHDLDGSDDDKLFFVRKLSSGLFEAVELTSVTAHTHTESDIADFNHEHAAFQGFDLRASRNAVTDGGLTITSTTGQVVLSDTQVLSSGVTYDVFVLADAQLSAGSGGFIEAAVEISGTGTSWSAEYLGTGTEGGERSVMPYGVDRAIAGSGQTITVELRAKRTTANGTVGTASLFGWIIPRGGGGVT